MPPRRRRGRCALAVAERSGKKQPKMTTSEASLPLLDRRCGKGENNNINNNADLDDDDDPPLFSTPTPSPSPPRFGDESPRPGELEAVRSSVKKKEKVKEKKVEAKLFPPLLLGAPPPTPLQNKKKKEEKKKKKPPASTTTTKIPHDARPALAAERERHRFDPRLPNPEWRPPPSPLSLLEEALFDRPWRLLVACCLLNKTTAGVARPCLREFFARYPDAAAAAAVRDEGDGDGGEEGGGELEAIAALFRPCGCHRRRAAAVVRLSREFLSPSWRDPRELFGVGEYAADAYWIFVRGIWHCGAAGEEEEKEREEEERATTTKLEGNGNGGGDKKAEKSRTSSPRSRSSHSPPPIRLSSFSWRPRDKDLAKYVDFLVETGGQGCGLEREEF